MARFGFQIIFWLVWAGLTAIIIHVDARKRRMAAVEQDLVDFTDASPMPYIALGLLCGLASLPLYFYSSRKTAGAAAIGFALGLATMLGAAVVTFAVAIPFAFLSR